MLGEASGAMRAALEPVTRAAEATGAIEATGAAEAIGVSDAETDGDATGLSDASADDGQGELEAEVLDERQASASTAQAGRPSDALPAPGVAMDVVLERAVARGSGPVIRLLRLTPTEGGGRLGRRGGLLGGLGGPRLRVPEGSERRADGPEGGRGMGVQFVDDWPDHGVEDGPPPTDDASPRDATGLGERR